ncbi:MAG: hypothetical protein CV087_23100 [Candidatus Brocadia sp. WS118]|nr:MAG: hypothetical protein CV087_23100 [Candidatus Brocadia sp. WS118]
MRYALILLTLLSSLSFSTSEEIYVIRPGKDYALFFAVNQYDNMRSLSNPIKDAKEIAKELEDFYGFETEVVENPTLDQIDQKLKFYQKQFASGRFARDGQLLLFFTGHGLVENKNGFFLVKDSNPEKLHNTAFLYDYWGPFLNTIDCKHILVAIDACFSGTFDPSWWNKSGRFGRPGELSDSERMLVEHEKYKTRMFFTSATEEESPDDSKFAKKFLEGLRSRGGQDPILTSTELFSYLEQASPRPHFGNFGDYDPGSSFLFILNNPLEISHINPEETNAIEKDFLAWKRARETNTINAYQAYLQQFPDGEFRGMAIGKIVEIEQEAANRREELSWEIAKEKNTEESYRSYLEQYPNGKFRSQAEAALEKKEPPPTNLKPPKTVDLSIAQDPAGQKYPTIHLNGKTWLAKNLNYNVGKESWCYEGKSANCDKYGRLYTWKAAKKACEALGPGWRLPTDAEWRALAKQYGGVFDDSSDRGVRAYEALTEDGNSGFDALLGGDRDPSGYSFFKEEYGHYWSSTENDAWKAWYYSFHRQTRRLSRNEKSKLAALSCRCIKGA